MNNNENTLRIAVRKFGPFEQTIEKLWKQFCEQTGCTLELDAPALDLHPLYDEIIADNGLKNGDYDISFINTDWITEAYESGSIESLTPYIDAQPPQDFPQGWSDSMLGFQDFGKDFVALPVHDGPECLIYRTDLFENEVEKAAFKAKTGKDLVVPETWDDFVEVARFFNRPEENLYGTAFAAFPDGHNTVFDFALQTWTRGGELVDENDCVIVNTPEAVKAMEFYRTILNDSSAVHPRSSEMDSVQSGMCFASGEIAMMINWFGFAAMSEVIDESVVKGKLDIAPIPHADGCKSAALNCYWMYVIGSGSTKKQIAYDFIKFAVSQESDKEMTLAGGTGCRKSTWFDDDVNAIIPYYRRLSVLHMPVHYRVKLIGPDLLM